MDLKGVGVLVKRHNPAIKPVIIAGDLGWVVYLERMSNDYNQWRMNVQVV
jgi:hypothetical protein